jgi:hypothetical protein
VTPTVGSYLAEFYTSPAEAQTYCRSLLPARYLPGVPRGAWAPDRNLAPASVWEHPGERHEPCIHANRERGQRVYVDVDDNYSDADLCDGYTAEKAGVHVRIVENADGVICASENLAERYADLNPNTHFIPSGVCLEEWEFPVEKTPYLRVGWGAGTTHDEDAPYIEEAMRWVSEQQGCQVIVLGVDPGWDFPYWRYPWMPLVAYRAMLRTLDIGLCPLKPDTSLNHYRSDLKFLDYTMAGAVTIASDGPAYNKSITHGATGLLARTAEDFTRLVREAVMDVAARCELLVNAREHVMLRRHAAGYRPDYMRALGYS